MAWPDLARGSGWSQAADGCDRREAVLTQTCPDAGPDKSHLGVTALQESALGVGFLLADSGQAGGSLAGKDSLEASSTQSTSARSCAASCSFIQLMDTGVLSRKLEEKIGAGSRRLPIGRRGEGKGGTRLLGGPAKRGDADASEMRDDEGAGPLTPASAFGARICPRISGTGHQTG
jgi:hypothetical protein